VRRRRGFSLLELLIVCALLGMFAGLTQESVVTGLRVVNTANSREQIRQELSLVLERIQRDAALADNVDRARDERFQFETPDVNNVDYGYDSATGTLTRDDGATAQITILRNITAFDFDYVDDGGAAMTTPVDDDDEDDVRVAQLSVTVAVGNESITMTAAAYLRNM